MKSFLKFIIVFGTILLLSAFLAPILYDFLPYKFERIFNRLVMIGSLVAIVAFVRISKQQMIDYGYKWMESSLRYFFIAFFASIAILSIVLVIGISTGDVKLALQGLSFWGWLKNFSTCLIAALLIGVIEEFFFRGFVFRTIKDRFAWGMGISLLITNVFYALLHFVGKHKPLILGDPAFRDSLTLLGAPFQSLLHLQGIWPEVVGLFIFGFMLNLLVIRGKSIYPAVGMHAGCVFFVKLDGLFVDFLTKGSLFWGTKKVYDGVLGWFIIVLLGILILSVIKRNADNPKKMLS